MHGPQAACPAWMCLLRSARSARLPSCPAPPAAGTAAASAAAASRHGQPRPPALHAGRTCSRPPRPRQPLRQPAPQPAPRHALGAAAQPTPVALLTGSGWCRRSCAAAAGGRPRMGRRRHQALQSWALGWTQTGSWQAPRCCCRPPARSAVTRRRAAHLLPTFLMHPSIHRCFLGTTSATSTLRPAGRPYAAPPPPCSFLHFFSPLPCSPAQNTCRLCCMNPWCERRGPHLPPPTCDPYLSLPCTRPCYPQAPPLRLFPHA